MPVVCQAAGDMLNTVCEWLRASGTRVLQISSFSVMHFYASTVFNTWHHMFRLNEIWWSLLALKTILIMWPSVFFFFGVCVCECIIIISGPGFCNLFSTELSRFHGLLILLIL